jgi:hypothetical protein
MVNPNYSVWFATIGAPRGGLSAAPDYPAGKAGRSNRVQGIDLLSEREMCPWAISKYFGDLVSNTSA